VRVWPELQHTHLHFSNRFLREAVFLCSGSGAPSGGRSPSRDSPRLWPWRGEAANGALSPAPRLPTRSTGHLTSRGPRLNTIESLTANLDLARNEAHKALAVWCLLY